MEAREQSKRTAAGRLQGPGKKTGAGTSARRSEMIDIQNALCGALGRENALLKQRALKLEVRGEAISRRIERARIRLDRARWESVQRQLARLSDSLQAPDGKEEPSRLAGAVRNLCRLGGVIE